MKNFVLSIFEWQLKTGFTVLMAYDVFSKVRGLNFGLSLHQHPYFVYMSSEGSGESAHMLKLRRILAAHWCDKYWNLGLWYTMVQGIFISHNIYIIVCFEQLASEEL